MRTSRRHVIREGRYEVATRVGEYEQFVIESGPDGISGSVHMDADVAQELLLDLGEYVAAINGRVEFTRLDAEPVFGKESV